MKKNSLKTRKIGKKAIAAWISWVLMIGFTVLIGAIVMNWFTHYTETQAIDLEERGARDIGCEGISFVVTGICQETQTLYINLTNTNKLGISHMVVRTYDLYDNSMLESTNLSLRPSTPETLTVIKQGTTLQADIVPGIISKNKIILCEDKKVIRTNITYC